MDKMVAKWYMKKIFATQLSFDMCCTVKSLKVEIERTEYVHVWGEYRVLLYPVICMFIKCRKISIHILDDPGVRILYRLAANSHISHGPRCYNESHLVYYTYCMYMYFNVHPKYRYKKLHRL